MKHIIRRCIFRPYRKGMGPVFTLTVWDTGRNHPRGTALLGYSLHIAEKGKRTLLFTGGQFSPSPMHSWDDDSTIAGIMGFLTLQPGDTDREYFEEYTAEQLEFCSQHAEALDCEVMARFGEQ